MTSKIINRAACLAKLTSNRKSFFNCPDLHGGVQTSPEGKLCVNGLANFERESPKFGPEAAPNFPLLKLMQS